MAGANRKSELWKLLKEGGWVSPATKTYVQYTEAELELEHNTLLAQNIFDQGYNGASAAVTEDVVVDLAKAPAEQTSAEYWGVQPEAVASEPEVEAVAFDLDLPPLEPEVTTPGELSIAESLALEFPDVPRTDVADPIAGLRLSTHGRNDPLRIDSRNRIWYQDEIRKPASAKARGRRVLRSRGGGTKVIETRNDLGLLEESFEVAGDEARDTEVKVTLPAWQVGIYKDPLLPFRVHQYSDVRAFDRLDVVAFYGSVDNVPSSIKILYVGSNLCYDISSVRDTLEREAREHMLQMGQYR